LNELICFYSTAFYRFIQGQNLFTAESAGLSTPARKNC
jgi:hypothetical protein